VKQLFFTQPDWVVHLKQPRQMPWFSKPQMHPPNRPYHFRVDVCDCSETARWAENAACLKPVHEIPTILEIYMVSPGGIRLDSSRLETSIMSLDGRLT
jgi:hypothetical protein